jgi:hypothetical protein
MAEICVLDPSFKIYGISSSVGDGCANKSDDVMLVQWLLKRHFDRYDKKALLGTIWFVNVVNGVYSKMLSEVIKIYQYDAIKNVPGCKMDIDGKIPPVKGVSNMNKSAILYLNLSVMGHFKNYYKNPKSDPYVYSEAKAMFDKCGSM